MRAISILVGFLVLFGVSFYYEYINCIGCFIPAIFGTFMLIFMVDYGLNLFAKGKQGESNAK